MRTWVRPAMRMNSLKSRAMNCGPLSEMIRAQAALQDDLDVGLGHALAQLPVYDGAREQPSSSEQR